MHIKQFFLLFLALSYFTLGYAETYEWVDEKGTKNYGDKVPAKYKNKAKIVEIKENVISAPVIPDIKKDVQTQQIDEEKPIVLERPVPRDSPNSEVRIDESCEVQKQRYKESQLCFAQYRNVRGGISEEGVRRCTAVQEPTCNTNTTSGR
jgi:hypothetical protein